MPGVALGIGNTLVSNIMGILASVEVCVLTGDTETL